MLTSPTVIKPDNSGTSERPETGAAQPTFKSEDIYPLALNSPTVGDTSPRTPAQHHPEVALYNSLSDFSKKQSIANRLPELKKSAYILLGLIIFSALQAVAMDTAFISMLGSRHESVFLSALNILGWSLGAVAAVVLLTTKNTKHAKYILLAVGLTLLHFAVTELLVLNVIGAAIDGFLIWWTYHLYQSVEALEM